MGEEQDLAQRDSARREAFPAQVDTQAFQVEHHPQSSARWAPDTPHAADLWKNH